MHEQILFDTYVELTEIDVISEKLMPYLLEYKYVILNGNLGAGKTTLVQNILKLLGSSDVVHSPTFSIINTYQAKHISKNISVLHCDLYRVQDIDELEMTGFFDQLEDIDVAFIEWGDKIDMTDEFEKYIVLNIDYIPTQSTGGRQYIAKAFNTHR